MALPNEIEKLNLDLIEALFELDEYSQIFVESQDRVNLINKIAPSFFVKLHDLYWDYFIMSVSRFTDPSSQSGNKNLSLEILLNYKDKLNDAGQKTLDDYLKTIKNEAKQIRKFRSKYISHRDLAYAILDKNDIGTIDLKKIETIYELISVCLNLFNNHFSNTTVLHRGLMTTPGARSLMYFIKEGIVYAEFKARRKNLFLNEEEIQQSQYKDA